jgi:hypothetical protein
LDQRLDGYVLDNVAREYRPMVKDENGRLRSQILGLDLGVAQGTYGNANTQWLRWFDREGHVLPHDGEHAAAAIQRADAEAREKEAAIARADAESKRVQELLAKLAQYESGALK